MGLNVLATKVSDDVYLFVKNQPMGTSGYLRMLLYKEFENSDTMGGKPKVNRVSSVGCGLTMEQEQKLQEAHYFIDNSLKGD